MLFSNLIVAQTIDDICEDGKGISTDPDNPVNLEATTEPWRLNDFDWKIQNPQNPQPIENQYFWFDDDDQKPLINPFTGPTDAEYFSYVTAGDASDYQYGKTVLRYMI